MKVNGAFVLAAVAALGITARASADDETAMARKSKVGMPEALAAAVAKAPGRVLWASRENDGGTLLYMVQVVGEDRASRLVSVSAKTGKVAKVEPMPQKAEKSEGDKKEGERKKEEAKSGPPPVTSSVRLSGQKPEEFPFLAKVPLADAMTAAHAKVRGRFVEVYLYESGGTLLYGVEITPAPGKIVLVQLDPATGAVLGTTGM